MSGVKGRSGGHKPPLPQFQVNPDRQAMVEALVGCGVSIEEIGTYMNLNRATVSKLYAEQIENGRAVFKSKLVLRVAQLALSGECPAATFFLLKTRFGFRETHHHEHDIHGLEKLTREELDAELQSLRARQEAADRVDAMAATLPRRTEDMVH